MACKEWPLDAVSPSVRAENKDGRPRADKPEEPTSRKLREPRNIAAEITFALVCSIAQLLHAALREDSSFKPNAFVNALHSEHAGLWWLLGPYVAAVSIAAVGSGSAFDLMPKDVVMVAVFGWLAIWGAAGAMVPAGTSSAMACFVWAMQHIGVGTVVTGAMSILRR